MQYKITLQGRVQGVGFRPFVYRKALEYGLDGSVSNNGEGVFILVRGHAKKVQAFYREVCERPPSISRVHTHQMETTTKAIGAGFHIVPSSNCEQLNLQLTPDFALCDDCREEVHAQDNRRFGYPFISCTNCGPRWALTREFPFEREHTSMEEFPMCPPCLEEYRDPLNRRFHSQTNSCATCGISYWLEDASGRRTGPSGPAVFSKVAEWLKAGKIIALKNTSGYLLVCDARQPAVVVELRRRKQRPKKPFALLYPSLDMLEASFDVPEPAREALESPERPIVLLKAGAAARDVASAQIAPGLDQLGVMLPYSGVLSLLAKAFPHPVIATSGNLHGAPICASRSEAAVQLSGIADYLLHHNLKIQNPQDDSVLRFGTQELAPILIRRSRGYAPNFSQSAKKGAGSGLLALGADLKSSIGFIPNDFVYLSQYLGNLENYEVYRRFTQNAERFARLFGREIRTVLTDAHPSYHSTRFGSEYAAQLGVPRVEIQHHKAHFAALLGEHQLWDSASPVLGVVWDGVGYGDDGQIWGGEFFSYDSGKMDRIGHLEEFSWLAGDRMSREPRLSLLALADAPTDRIRAKFNTEHWQVYRTLRAENSLRTSSMGRLFDAVASLLGLCDINTYEGEAAMYLEAIAGRISTGPRLSLAGLDASGGIPARALIKAIEQGLDDGRATAELAADFLFTLAQLILDKARFENYDHIGCSGGVFQNAQLVAYLHRLNAGRRKLYFHRELSPNDENIAFGQMMYYLYCNP